jgi:hypothetical protein
MSILSLPYDLIIEISRYLNKELITTKIIGNYKELLGSGCYYYPFWCLYVTSKHFTFLNQYEYVSVISYEFDHDIMCKNINGSYHGMSYQIKNRIVGYGYKNYQSSNFNYLHWSHGQGIRYTGKKNYIENCKRSFKYCEDFCKSCCQLNEIQKVVFKHDSDIELIIKNLHSQNVLVRLPKSILNIRFDFSHLKEITS